MDAIPVVTKRYLHQLRSSYSSNAFARGWDDTSPRCCKRWQASPYCQQLNKQITNDLRLGQGGNQLFQIWGCPGANLGQDLDNLKDHPEVVFQPSSHMALNRQAAINTGMFFALIVMMYPTWSAHLWKVHPSLKHMFIADLHSISSLLVSALY